MKLIVSLILGTIGQTIRMETLFSSFAYYFIVEKDLSSRIRGEISKNITHSSSKNLMRRLFLV